MKDLDALVDAWLKEHSHGGVIECEHADARFLAQAAREMGEREGWRPIETAPKAESASLRAALEDAREAMKGAAEVLEAVANADPWEDTISGLEVYATSGEKYLQPAARAALARLTALLTEHGKEAGK
jgi:hypothetical protein